MALSEFDYSLKYGEILSDEEEDYRRRCLELLIKGTSDPDSEKKTGEKWRQNLTSRPYYSLKKSEFDTLRTKFKIAYRNHEAGPVFNSLKSLMLCRSDLFILKNRFDESTHVMLTTCDKKFCPHCGIEWSKNLQRKMKLRTMMIPPKELRHVVLTIPNARKGELSSRIEQLYDAFRQWKKEGRKLKNAGWFADVKGCAWKLEIDKKKGKGWHPHLHVLLHVPKGINLTRGSPGREAWIRKTANVGAKASFFSGIYITRITSENHEREIAKYSMKPLQIKHLHSTELEELVWSTHGRRFFASSGTLKFDNFEKEKLETEWEMITSFSKLSSNMKKLDDDGIMMLNECLELIHKNEELGSHFPDSVRRMALELNTEMKAKGNEED